MQAAFTEGLRDAKRKNAMLEGLLLMLDIFGMLLLMRWSIAQERSTRPPLGAGSTIKRR